MRIILTTHRIFLPLFQDKRFVWAHFFFALTADCVIRQNHPALRVKQNGFFRQNALLRRKVQHRVQSFLACKVPLQNVNVTCLFQNPEIAVNKSRLIFAQGDKLLVEREYRIAVSLLRSHVVEGAV